jgi:hypothetical protein
VRNSFANGGNGIVEKPSGRYFAVGYRTTDELTGLRDFHLQLFNSNGSESTWDSYGRVGDDEVAYDIAAARNDEYIIVGYKDPDPGIIQSVFAVKIDAAGDTIWTYRYSGANPKAGQGSEMMMSTPWYHFAAYSVDTTSDGGFVMAGVAEDGDTGVEDFYLVKVNSSGQLVWDRIFGGLADDVAYGVRVREDGRIVVTGITESFGAGDHDCYVVITDSEGNTLETATYGTTGDDRAYALDLTDDGGYIIAGQTNTGSGGAWDAYVVKAEPLEPLSCCIGLTGNVDCSVDQIIDIGDVNEMIRLLFLDPEAEPCCFEEADLDFSGELDIGDLTILQTRLFVTLEPFDPCP